jgi:hypothetical protein
MSQTNADDEDLASPKVEVKNSTTVELHTQQRSAAANDTKKSSASANTQASLKIEGEQVDIPENGEFHRTTESPDGSTSTVDISVHGDGSVSSSSSSSVTVDVTNEAP